MSYFQPGGWGRRLVATLLVVIAIAVAARVVYDLLSPLLPLAVALLVVGGLYLLTVGRWRH